MSFPTPARRPLGLAATLAALAIALCQAQAASAAGVSVAPAWRYAHAGEQKSEIVAYDRRSDTLWVAGVVGVDVLDRATGQPVAHIPVTNFGNVNSVAIHEGLAALAIENAADRTRPGVVVFYDTRSRRQVGQPVVVGVLPDMVTFTPDGKQVLVANEGTPNAPTAADPFPYDPPGSVSIVDVKRRSVTTLAIDPAIPGYDALRQFPPSMPSYGPEPEYIAIDKAGKIAYVTLQEANGIAVLNLKTRRFERIYGLGLKDFSLPGNEIDPSDRDGERRLRSVPVKGLYQPDTIASYEYRGRTYNVMANEGDSREEGEDETRGSGFAGIPDELKRLTLSNVDSADNGPFVAFGGHSFSIRDADGRIVFDSGSQLDAKAIELGIYDDGRSDNKGVEPEGVALLKIKGRTLAFIGLERTLKSAVAIYDITDPAHAEFLDMIVSDGDVSPEGLVAFKAKGRYFLAVANEVSDTTLLFEIRLPKGEHDRNEGEAEDDD